jgi:hypothetical protein
VAQWESKMSSDANHRNGAHDEPEVTDGDAAADLGL